MSKICKSVLVVLSAMAAFFAHGAHAKERPRPTPTFPPEEINLQKVHAEFRRSIITEMQKAARQAGVKIRTDNLVAIPFDDSGTVIVNAMIEGADRVSIEQLAQGADVLFIYPGGKLGFAGREIDPGFYVVRISQNPASGQWLAQFKNLEGRVVLETEAIVEKPDSKAAKMQPMCMLGPKGEPILFGERDQNKNIVIKVRWTECPSCYKHLVLESRPLRQAAWQIVKKVTGESVSIEKVFPVVSAALEDLLMTYNETPQPQAYYSLCVGWDSKGNCDTWKFCMKTKSGDIRCWLIGHVNGRWWVCEIDILWS
jgi:hypothetical protein